MNPIYIPIVTSNEPMSQEGSEALASVLVGALVIITAIHLLLETANFIYWIWFRANKKRKYQYFEFPAEILLIIFRFINIGIWGIMFFVWVSYRIGSMF
jgi:hypothetical protein